VGRQLAYQGRRQEAEPLVRQALAQQRRLLGDHVEVRTTLASLAQLRQQEGDHEEAVALHREAVAIAERTYPEGHPESFRRASDIGKLAVALEQQARAVLPADRVRALTLFEEAALLLSIAYHGIASDPRSSDRENVRRSAEWTADVFEFWHSVDPDKGWGEQAARYRSELERLPAP
jgi:hypothetical protein